MDGGLTAGLIRTVGLISWSGFCAVDQRTGGRQIHQPLVAASAAGAILGHPEVGLAIGFWFQLVWPAPLPVGGSLPPDTGSSAAAAAAIACVVPTDGGFICGIAVGGATAALAMVSERALRRASARREEKTLRTVEGIGLGRGIGAALSAVWLRGALLAGAALILARLMADPIRTRLDPVLPSSIRHSLTAAAVILGAGQMIAGRRRDAGPRWAYWIGAGALFGGIGRYVWETLR